MSLGRTGMFANFINQRGCEGEASFEVFVVRSLCGSFRYLVIAACWLLSAFVLQVDVLASDVTDFLGRRVTKVDVVIEGAPNSNVAEMKSLVDVAPGQDYSPVRIHDSLIRL